MGILLYMLVISCYWLAAINWLKSEEKTSSVKTIIEKYAVTPKTEKEIKAYRLRQTYACNHLLRFAPNLCEYFRPKHICVQCRKNKTQGKHDFFVLIKFRKGSTQ